MSIQLQGETSQELQMVVSLHYRLLSPTQMFHNYTDNPSKDHIGQHTNNKRLHKSPPGQQKDQA